MLTNSNLLTNDTYRIGQQISAPSSPGSNYLECLGQVLAQADYPALYSAIGLIKAPARLIFGETALSSRVWTNVWCADGLAVFVGANGKIAVQNLETRVVTEYNGPNTSIQLEDVYYDSTADLWVAVGASGQIWTAPDPASTWTSRTSGVAVTLYGVTRLGTTWIVVGASGKILTASDATSTWTAQTSGTAVNLTGVTNNGTTAVAVGASGTILSSTNGTDWTSRTSGVTIDLSHVVYDSTAGKFATGSSPILTSTAGSSWTNVPWDSYDADSTYPYAKLCSYAGKLYLSPQIYGRVRVYDLSTGEQTFGDGCTSQPTGIGTDGERLWVLRAGSQFTYEIDAANYTTSTQFALPNTSRPSRGDRRWVRAS